MSYTFRKTHWPPQAIDPAVKHLIERYYTLADFNGPDAGDVLADEVFTETGTMIGPTHKFCGSEEIRTSLKGPVSPVISRRHEILRVYIGDDKGYDLMLIGTNMATLKSGYEIIGDFAARFLIDDESVRKGAPRLKLSQVYTDTAPMAAAMKND
ncbi:hypothetical protein DTO207G8_3130 [Paecilomyces variotii]|nr:hypothetical protein DTO207G8_3130 [Paecilomyces variotii]KAJ9400642.1 hypothetical protein DTO282F9_2527 [Paecilomyces variotii]